MLSRAACRIAPVRASLGALPLDALRARPHGEEVREVEGNWKLHAWNYMDTFHIPYIHRAPGGLADAIEPEEPGDGEQ